MMRDLPGGCKKFTTSFTISGLWSQIRNHRCADNSTTTLNKTGHRCDVHQLQLAACSCIQYNLSVWLYCKAMPLVITKYLLRNWQTISWSRNLPPLLSPKVHYRFRETPPLNSILTQLNPIHDLTPYTFQIHFNITIPSMSMFTRSEFPTNLHRTDRSTCVTHLALLESISVIIFGEDSKLWSAHSYL